LLKLPDGGGERLHRLPVESVVDLLAVERQRDDATPVAFDSDAVGYASH
jgi:hypothetical protein